MRLLIAAKQLILSTLFPPVCVSCKTEGDFLCKNCVETFVKRKIATNYKKELDPDLHHLDGVIYGLDYAKNPQIQAAISQFKYKFTEELADYFADLIVEKMGELSMTQNKEIVLIPVPLHKKRLNYRGFNQAELIARAVQARMGSRVKVRPLLERIRHTSQQAKLNVKSRHENLNGAFSMNTNFVQEQKICSSIDPACPERSRGGQGDKIHFLVDDVCTTGSTLEYCAQTLKSSGLSKVYGLVVAKAMKKGV